MPGSSICRIKPASTIARFVAHGVGELGTTPPGSASTAAAREPSLLQM